MHCRFKRTVQVQVKFLCPQNISRASLQNSVAAFSIKGRLGLVLKHKNITEKKLLERSQIELIKIYLHTTPIIHTHNLAALTSKTVSVTSCQSGQGDFLVIWHSSSESSRLQSTPLCWAKVDTEPSISLRTGLMRKLKLPFRAGL